MKRKIVEVLYKTINRPILFAFDGESIHNKSKTVLAFAGKFRLARAVMRSLFRYDDAVLRSQLHGTIYQNPIGLSAGMDKNAELLNVIGELGFGFEEIGSITGEECLGNPLPRLWRAKKTKSINVWMGLNNKGSKVLAPEIKEKLKTSTAIGGISAAMINANATVEDGIIDYTKTVTEFAGIGKFLVINISCPNTLQGEPFATTQNLDLLLTKLKAVRTELNDTKPWYVKFSPDMTDEIERALVDVCATHSVNGIVTTNLTKDKHGILLEDLDDCPTDVGGMSGTLVKEKSNATLVNVAQHIKDKSYDMIVFGVGGISTAEDAYFKIRNGASLLLLVSALVFEGPQVVGQINKGLAELLRKDGFRNITEAIGVDLN